MSILLFLINEMINIIIHLRYYKIVNEIIKKLKLIVIKLIFKLI